MASRNLSVEQFKDLMKRIPPAVADEMAKAVEAAAEDLVRVIQSAVPVRSGALRRSVRHEKGAHGLARVVRAGGPLTTRPVRKGVSVTFDYSLAQEFGTREHNAQPFFWPSYRLRKKSLRNKIARVVRPAMQKIVRVE